MKLLLALAALLSAALVLAVACASADHHDGGVADAPATPTGIRWTDYQGVAIPLTDQGPRTYTPSVAAGFDPSPAGAAVAAIVHTIRMSLAPDGAWAQIAAAELAPGPGKDTWATARVLFSITHPADSASAPRILGYSVDEYGPGQHAQVTVFTAYPDASLAATRTVVVWMGEDWRLQLPDPHSTQRLVQTISQIPEKAVRLEKAR
ncbi:hypothetical protein [Nocardia sp. CDC160]|uniref:hypothetical protein n=1 Tax=Nocardia sp. CDC160 TaxID=3112166 RepID=UPI002DB88B01|nr:hypothetical protein [Nocardia sp. CDC160]MEC3919315.1 hypothetical protein [Nocardia sp. CDC160]